MVARNRRAPKNTANAQAEPTTSNPFEFKTRAIEVTFSNGYSIFVQEPKIDSLSIYLRAWPSLNEIIEAYKVFDKTEEGIAGMQVLISDSIADKIGPLFAVMVPGLTVEIFKQMPLWDGLGLLNAFWQFGPKKTKEPETTEPQPSIS